MQTLRRRFSVIGGFAVLLIMLVANALVIRRQLATQTMNRDRLAHSVQVRLQLARVLSLLQDAETGQRGFLYTGDPQYLAPYNRTISQVGPSLDELAKITADDPRQQAQIPALRSLSQKKLSELAQTIALFQADNLDEARALVTSNTGFVFMNVLREQIRSMEQQEDIQEALRSADYLHSRKVTIACIYVATSVAALGSILLAFYILREMDLRELHARQIREREEWFRVTLTSLGDAVIAADEHGLVTFLNPMAEELTGHMLKFAKGKTIEEIFPIFNEHTHQPVENPVQKVLKMGVVVGLANHTVLRHVDGSLRPIEDSAAPIRDDRDNLIGVVLVFRDATRERESQEMLRKTEKLAAAARLAATFSHEINNPLEAVVNLIYIVKGIEGIPAAAIEPLDFAEHELERISHIVRQTLGFYRESKVAGPVDLSAIVDNVLKLYSNKLRTKNIQVERDFSECPPIHGLAGELTQAVSNLISNAADAVPLAGTIRIRLSAAHEMEGICAKLVIEDNGPGVAPDLQKRIFEPFFTTKLDVGTGLGLWVTREILQRHRGRIEVNSVSESGVTGAVFTLFIPCVP